MLMLLRQNICLDFLILQILRTIPKDQWFHNPYLEQLVCNNMCLNPADSTLMTHTALAMGLYCMGSRPLLKDTPAKKRPSLWRIQAMSDSILAF